MTGKCDTSPGDLVSAVTPVTALTKMVNTGGRGVTWSGKCNTSTGDLVSAVAPVAALLNWFPRKFTSHGHSVSAVTLL